LMIQRKVNGEHLDEKRGQSDHYPHLQDSLAQPNQ